MSAGVEGRTVVVTGGGGFIGRAVVRALLASGARVRALAGAPGDLLPPLPAGVAELRADITDAGAVRECVAEADAVVHLAGPASVAASFSRAAEYARAHVQGSATVLDACREAGVARVVLVSSAEVYGRPRSSPVREDHPLAPRSPYAAAKAGAEHFAQAFAAAFGMGVVILRPFSVYGPGAAPGSLVGTIVDAVRRGDPVRLHDLAPVRDYCFVDDVARAVAAACHRPLPPGTVLNVGTGTGTSVAGVAAAALEAAGRTLPVEERGGGRPAAADIPALVADPSRARRLLEWEAEVELRAGLALTLRALEARAPAALAG